MFERDDGLDWRTVPDGYEEEGITSLIDSGLQTVPVYRRDPGILEDDRQISDDVWDLAWSGDWRQMLTPGGTMNRWEQDRDRLYIHEAEYAVFERYGFNWCALRITASRADDVDPASGTRLDDPDGRRGHIHVTGYLPGDVHPEQHVEQYLDPDA